MPFTVPNTAAAAFTPQASLDSGDLAILAAGSGLTGVVSGCTVTAQGAPNMTVAVAAGVVRIGGRRVAVTGGNVTIASADGTNPRHDLITVDTSGTLAAVAGTPAAVTTTAEPVYAAIPASRVVLATVYVPAADAAINANQITDKRVIVAEPPALVSDYVIYTSGGTIYAVNGATGATDYSGSEPGAVLSSVIAALGTNGGTVAFKAGTYAWASTPGLPANLSNWLRLIAEPGVKITLSTAAPRFLDFNRQNANDTFRYLHIEGFTIDAAALASTGSGHHMVLGTFTAGGTLTGQDVNFDHITIRRVRTLNVRTAADATAQHFNVWIALHATNNATQYKITNILVEQCEFNGGNYGVGVYGTRQSGFTGADADIWQDNIVIRDIYHDTGSVPAAFGSFAHVHVGSGAKGGTCWIERIIGKNSWDVGIEVDNFETAYVRDCYFENTFGFAVAITNFVTVPNLKAQTYYLTNITQHRLAGAWSSDSSSLVGMVPSANGAGVTQTFGRVIARNLKFFRSGSSLDGPGVEGDLVHLKLSMIEFLLDGGEYQATGLTHSAVGNTPTIVFTTPAARTKATFRNVDVRLDGTWTGTPVEIDTIAFYLSGYLDLLVENCSVTMNFANNAANSQRGMEIGGAGAGLSTVTGTVRGFRFTCNDVAGHGVVVHNATNMTITNRLLIDGCDFSGMTGGPELTFIDTPNKVKTWVQGTTWRTYPMAPYTLAAPTSAAATRYAETYDATLLITGGTVSVVEVSRDGATFYRVASATNVAVPIQHTDYYRITYTVAPTITVLPRI